VSGAWHDVCFPTEHPSKAFSGVSVLLFAAGAAVTIVFCNRMAAIKLSFRSLSRRIRV